METSITRDLSEMSPHEQMRAAETTRDPELQAELLHSGREILRLALALNAWLAPELQLEVALSPDSMERQWLASNIKVTPEAQHLLTRSTDISVLSALMANKNVALSQDHPVAFLELGRRGRSFIEESLARASLESQEQASLRTGWTGTLGELVETAEEFAPGQSHP
jgi:hypothetical protein